MITFLGSWLSTSAVIRSYPGDFFRGNFEIVYFTSAGEKCLGGRDICNGMSRNRSTSLIFFGRRMVLCGWNVSARWFANIFALSMSECTQLPLASCRIAGGLCTRISCFVAFQREPSFVVSDFKWLV